ncbi:MAG: dUTP diphosphatase [Erysipelotrichaceae bacterium]|nr:dUTP diphosphatase [Erysipelotrichaceae bacterium]
MKIADFEKVSQEQYSSDLKALLGREDDSYQMVKIPARATSGSAGYDFCSPVEVLLRPGESVKIPTGIRCRIDEGYVLQLYPRSSLGFKYQMALLNTVGIIDSDYYNADNEGHIIIGIVNRGEKDLLIRSGDRFVQGIFSHYYLADEEENLNQRHGGFGSTG